MLTKPSSLITIAAYAMGIVFTPITIVSKTEKHESQVFSKWHAWQQIYEDHNISDLKKKLDDKTFVETFKTHYENNLSLLKPLGSFLNLLSNDAIKNDGYLLKSPLDDGFKANMSFVYDAIEHSMPDFIICLAKNNFCNQGVNSDEQKAHFDTTIEKYKALARLFFVNDDSLLENEHLFAFANRMFEYCYDDKTYHHYKTLMTSPDLYSIARFTNAVMWYHLVGDGWKHWHKDALKAVKQEADQGKEIIYIAGGTDVYQLLREGIFNITIIDPFLPTQARYYSEGWDFLVEGENNGLGIGDEIRFGPTCDSIKMKRISAAQGETFQTKTSNNTITSLKKSIITWEVFDRSNNQIGHVIIHRRPVVQDDLVTSDKTRLVASYDEMIYLALPDMLNGWGIDPTKLSSDFTMHVKQLRKPITKNTLLNMRTISMINFADLRFINLGSDPT